MSITAAAIHAKKAEITGPGGFFELEQRDLDGRSVNIYKHASASLIDVLQSGRNHGDQEFMIYEGARYSYTGFFAQVDALAACLQQDFGIRKGDRVAIAMRNNPEWLLAFTAAALIGAVVVPINSWGKTEELHYAVTDCGAALLVCDRARFDLIATRFAEIGIPAIIAGDELSGLPANCQGMAACIARGEGREYTLATPAPEDHCLILYTSGSTGFPKGVVHRHIAVCQSLMNMMFLGMLVMELEGPREMRGGASRDTPLLTVPLFHATGLLGGYLLPLQMASKLVMMYKWDSAKALKLIEQERVTTLSTVPAILKDLLNHPEFDSHDTSSLLRMTGAGAATPAGLPELVAEKVPEPSRSAGWGMTETLAAGSTMSGVIFDLKPDSAGIPSPVVEFRFTDTEGNCLQAGEPGEIEVRGVVCTPGYWEKPEANASTFDGDGWMKTGDIGRIDADGFLHITGRIKEIVIRGGENIYPGEIESAAYQLDAVQEAVVFGVPDEAMGEELVMVAFARSGASLDETSLRAHLRERLAGFKVPQTIVISDTALPRNASEKLHKLKVREHYLNTAATSE